MFPSHDTWWLPSVINGAFMLYIQCHVTALDLSMLNGMAKGAMCKDILPYHMSHGMLT